MEATDPVLSSIYDAHPLDLQDATRIRLLEPVYHQTCFNDDPPEPRMQSVRYRLHVVSLKDAPPFTALSYVWGSPETTKSISLEGKLIKVRENLWDFLSYHEPQESRKYLWIDALCIDQNSVKERNHQVGIMGQIYRRAAMVIAWLGLGHEEALTRIPAALDDVLAMLGPKVDFSKEVRYTSAFLLYRRLLRSLSETDYWSRLWIVQEYAVCPCLRLGSGRALLDIDAVFTRIDTTAGIAYEMAFNHLSAEARRVVYARRKVLKRQSGQYSYSSDEVFGNFRQCKCADARDHVFGVVGLVDKEELARYPIAIDYSQSIAMLFTEMYERRRRQLIDAQVEVSPNFTFEDRLGYAADRLRSALQLPTGFGLGDGIPSHRASMENRTRRRKTGPKKRGASVEEGCTSS